MGACLGSQKLEGDPQLLKKRDKRERLVTDIRIEVLLSPEAILKQKKERW